MNFIDQTLLSISDYDSEGAAILIAFIAIFGNFALMLVAALLCFPAKHIHKVIYDLFGFITGASLLAIFANLLFTMPIALMIGSARLSLFIACIITLLCYLLVLYKSRTLNNMGKAIENVSFENRSDEFYADFYEKHYKNFFRDFFKEPPPEITKRLFEGFKQAYQLGQSISFSEEFVAQFINDFAHEFPIDTPVEHIEKLLHQFFEKNYTKFITKFPNEFPESY